MNDEAHRTAARCGVGAVMGYKKLKAIAVSGTKTVPVADLEKLKSIYAEVVKHIQENPRKSFFAKAGTPRLVSSAWMLGDLPAFNWSGKTFGPGDSWIEELSYPGGYEKILVGRRTCFLCVTGCRRVVTVKYGAYEAEGVEGPEYETLGALGTNCGIHDVKALAVANNLCNMYGMDTISTGGVIGFAMECFERGLIGLEDTGGIELKFGNAEAMIQMIHKIAFREGFGDILAEGVRRASRIIGKGSENFAMHVKGLELPAYDPRGAKAQGLSYAVSNRGACHLRAYMIKYEIFGTPFKVDRFDQSTGKVKLLINTEHEYAVIDSLVLCIRLPLAVDFGTIAKLLSSATGWDFSEKELYEIGERIWNLERLFNVREGFSREHDTLPPRILTEPLREGPAAGHVVNLKDMLEDYYKLRGWDENGKPTEEKLKQLKLL
jgi:aldehyde:ferredoxin oxidoreductase